MKILAACGREVSYPRNALVINSLNSCHELTVVAPFQNSQSIVIRSLASVFICLWRLIVNKYDLIYIGFYGQLIALLISPFTRKPIILDAFISTYDTLVNDRNKFREGSFGSRMARWLDKHACNKAQLVFVDTQVQCDYFSQEYGLDKSILKRIFVSADQTVFYPRPKPNNEVPVILTYSTFLPIHGTRYILEVARSLPGVTFQLIGKGMELEEAKTFVNTNKLSNVTFFPQATLNHLPQFMERADIFLGGHFGTSHKARSVIAAKTFQALAMGLPTIVTDNPANREIFGDEMSEAFCEHGSTESLRNAILRILNDDNLRTRLGAIGYQIFTNKASQGTVRGEILEAVSRVIREHHVVDSGQNNLGD